MRKSSHIVVKVSITLGEMCQDGPGLDNVQL